MRMKTKSLQNLMILSQKENGYNIKCKARDND